MRTIGQVLNSTASYRRVAVPELPNVGGIGIELELESPRPFRDVAGWERTSDGSLRDGIEYVFDGPQAGQQALSSILAMGEELQANPPDPSFRCSTHIHMDVRDLDFNELDRLVALYTMYESVMFDHCAPYRRFSNFCPPYFINDQQVRHFNTYFRGAAHPGSKLGYLRSQWNKYSALNLKVTGEIGSVEFRGSHALTTSEELLALAQRMLHLKRFVKETPADDCMSFVTRARQAGLRDVFQQGLRENYTPDRELQDICYSNAVFLASSDWAYDEAAASRDTDQSLSWGEAASRARRERPAPVAEAWSRIDPETFRNYNIDPSVLRSHPSDSNYKSLASIAQVYQALRSLRGVQPPTFNSLLEEGVTVTTLCGDYSPQRIARIMGDAGIAWNQELLSGLV